MDYGHFLPWSFRSKNNESFRSSLGLKNELIEQISGSERNKFLYSEQNDHETKRPDTNWIRSADAEPLKEPALNDQKQELGTALQLLKEFDLDSEYGPCIGKYMLTFWLAGTCSKPSLICLLLLLYLFSITLLAASYWYQAIKMFNMLSQALQGLKDGNELKSMDFTHQRKLKKSF